MINLPQTNTNSISSETIENECIYGRNLWLFDALKSHSSGPGIYRKLVENAVISIKVLDPYLNEGDAKLFNNINPNVDVNILTTFGINGGNYPLTFNKFFTEIKGYESLCKYNLTVKILNSREIQNIDKKPFHDRYLLVDDRAFFVGSSLTYHAIENEIENNKIATTSINEITDNADILLINEQFEDYWNSKYSIVAQ